MSKFTNPWKQLSSEVIHKNPWYSVRKDRVIRPSGQPGDYFVVDSAGAVYIVAVNEQDEVCVIGQFRYPTNMYSLELPAGSHENGDILQAAQRELQEETGLVAAHWQKLGTFQSANGLLSEMSHAFLARDLRQTHKNKKHEEGITEVRRVPMSQLLTMIHAGEFTDGQSMAAVLLAALELGYLPAKS